MHWIGFLHGVTFERVTLGGVFFRRPFFAFLCRFCFFCLFFSGVLPCLCNWCQADWAGQHHHHKFFHKNRIIVKILAIKQLCFCESFMNFSFWFLFSLCNYSLHNHRYFLCIQFDQSINFIKPSLFLLCFMDKNQINKRHNFVLVYRLVN